MLRLTIAIDINRTVVRDPLAHRVHKRVKTSAK